MREDLVPTVDPAKVEAATPKSAAIERGDWVSNGASSGQAIALHRGWVWMMSTYDGRECPLTFRVSDLRLVRKRSAADDRPAVAKAVTDA